MYNISKFENIQHDIFNFNLKRKFIIEYITKNFIITDDIDIPEIHINENNIHDINNIIQIMKTNLHKLKQQLNNQLVTNQVQDISINRYIKQYNITDNIFWGIGLENECYLQAKSKPILGKNIIPMLGKERYSVDYTANYDIDQVKNVMSYVYNSMNLYNVSQMINSHSLDKMDKFGEHKTSYEIEPKLNTIFSGKTVLEEWFDYDDKIKQIINPKTKTESNIFFDGDTIEFITEKFYKTNTQTVVQELTDNKRYFIDSFNDFKTKTNLWDDMGEVRYLDTHPGINIFKSQPDKIVFFNNTTIHIHLTLVTELKNGFIVDKDLFIQSHSRAIRLLQWFEPFFICTLGSPDILQLVYDKYEKLGKLGKLGNDYFARGSQRATMSRYIGIGTYDTRTMISGKLLKESIDKIRPNKVIWWRDMIAEDLSYKLPEKEIGFDFNYGKHYQSGLEFRILDGIPLDILKDVLDVIILICEHSYNYENQENIQFCSESQSWNNIVYKSLVYGYKAIISKNEIEDILKILNINMSIDENKLTLEDFYYRILEYLFELYSRGNETHVIKYMTKDFYKINRWENYNKKQELAHMQSLEPI
jgi:hypothetical protein